ncbi:MAG: hypothetical protein PUB01_08025 [Desulfovibrionaceae bacterium]|nr:hypothetical protein [Desulfovibrionaceae bacterium]
MNTRSTGGTGRHARKHAGMRGNAAATAIICLLVAGLAGTLLTRYLSPVQISVSDAALVATADNLADSYLAMLRQKIRHAGGKEAVIAYFHDRPVIMPMNGQDCVVTGTLINSKNKGISPNFVQDNDDNIKLTLSIALPSTDARGEFSEIRADRVLSIKKDYLLEDEDTFDKRSAFAQKTASEQFQKILNEFGEPHDEISCFDDDWKYLAQKNESSDEQDMYWSITKNDAGKWEYRSAYLPPDLDQFPRDDTVCVNRLILTDTTPNETSTTWRVWWTAESMPYEELPSVPAN